MVGVEGIADWIGREVVDRDGEGVGKLADVFYDTADSEAVFVAVKSGAFGRSRTVAPLRGATLARDYVRLDATKELVKDAPSEDAGGRLTGLDALAVLRHYGLPGEPDLEGEERVCFQTAGAAEETERKRAELAAGQAREEPGAATGDFQAAERPEPEPDRDSGEDDGPPPLPAAPASPAVLVDDDAPLTRLAELERRVAALEDRLM